jgi:arsenate reductase
MTDPIRVLFVCTHNSARSQIAEALLERDGGGAFRVESAGTEARGVHPLAVRALDEVGIDWSGASSKLVSQFVGREWDYVITVCDTARQACPVVPGARRMLHWDLEDPSAIPGSDEERLRAFRRTRTEIADRVGAFVDEARRGAPA